MLVFVEIVAESMECSSSKEVVTLGDIYCGIVVGTVENG